jgi:hypothetical protein
MNTTFDVLVIVLSCLLGLFLILSIIVTILILKIVGSVKRLVAKGEEVIDSAEAAAAMIKKASGPIGAIRTITSLIETVAKHKRGKE